MIWIFEILPTIANVLLVVISGYVVFALYSFARKIHKQLLSQAIADCIEEQSEYDKFESVDDFIAQMISHEENRRNISDSFVEGGYYLFITEKYARDKMEGIYRKLGKADSQFPEALESWRNRGLGAGISRIETRIRQYDDRLRVTFLLLFKKRIDKFRRHSITKYSDVFLSIQEYVRKNDRLTKSQLLARDL